MKDHRSLVTVLLGCLALICGSATAEPNGMGTGSCLVFPYVHSSDGAATLITITNTNRDSTYCDADDTRAGDTLLHFVYVDGASLSPSNTYEFSTPGDTTTYLVERHDPRIESGYLVVTASLPTEQQFGDPVDFDYLVGSALVVESGLDFMWSYQPYVFEAATGDPIACERRLTDLDGDGAFDFDGSEYAKLPSEIFIDGFFEEKGRISNRLVLISMGDRAHTNEVTVFVYNNVADPTATLFEMPGFWTGSLSDVSFVAENLDGDPEEAPIETGWAVIAGSRMLDRSGNAVRDASGGVATAPILGVFTQFVGPLGLSFGHALHHGGDLDGLEFFTGNGDPQQP